MSEPGAVATGFFDQITKKLSAIIKKHGATTKKPRATTKKLMQKPARSKGTMKKHVAATKILSAIDQKVFDTGKK